MVTLFNEVAFVNANIGSSETAAGEPDTANIGLEEGQSERDFVGAVVTVVEIEEEGLFRHILGYL